MHCCENHEPNLWVYGWQVWRTVLEGALLEARAGNNAVARKVFKVRRTTYKHKTDPQSFLFA
jgi:hypothetical protein